MSNDFQHEFYISADHPCFKGHFPDFPVFPAVGQLSLLAEVVSILHGKTCQITAIPVAKFLTPLGPGTAVKVELQQKGENCASFVINSAKGVVAKGNVDYRIVTP